jgi:hypothetical protein
MVAIMKYNNSTFANSVYNQLLGIKPACQRQAQARQAGCEYYHFVVLRFISIQNHFGNATDHTRERWQQYGKICE